MIEKHDFFSNLIFTNRFWTFINVHFPKGPFGSAKNPAFLTCDHYALISVFSGKML